MKREIKFRAWIENAMCYDIAELEYQHYCIVVNDHPSEERAFSLEEAELMQFTGLKDSKGTEIHEGDIVAVENEGDVITICKWDKGGFTLEDNAGGHWTRQLFHQPDRIEVIGNIYENPELLK